MSVIERGWDTCPNKPGRKAGLERKVTSGQVFRGSVMTIGESGCEQLCNYGPDRNKPQGERSLRKQAHYEA